jgi:hypothetical protein
MKDFWDPFIENFHSSWISESLSRSPGMHFKHISKFMFPDKILTLWVSFFLRNKQIHLGLPEVQSTVQNEQRFLLAVARREIPYWDLQERVQLFLWWTNTIWFKSHFTRIIQIIPQFTVTILNYGGEWIQIWYIWDIVGMFVNAHNLPHTHNKKFYNILYIGGGYKQKI